MRLPVIAGFGGINAAGRSSGHHAYRRMVIDALPGELADETWASLARLMGVADAGDRSQLASGTLVRRIEGELFDVDAVPWNRRMVAHSEEFPMQFRTQLRQLPPEVPEGWRVTAVDDLHVHVEIDQGMVFLLPTHREAGVKAAGQLPRGFDPGTLYPSRNHPRGLQMTVYAASDALGGSGLDAPGYDLLALMNGSEGMLGIITEITVRLLPQPQQTRVILAAYNDIAHAGEAVGAIIAAGIIPAGLEMMDNPAIRAAEAFVHAGYPQDAAAILLCELDGTDEEVNEQSSQVEQLLHQPGKTVRSLLHLCRPARTIK